MLLQLMPHAVLANCACRQYSADMLHSIFLSSPIEQPTLQSQTNATTHASVICWLVAWLHHSKLSKLWFATAFDTQVTFDSLSADLLSRSKTASSAKLSSSMRMMSPCRMAVTNGPSAHSKGARALAAASIIVPTSCRSLLCSAASRQAMYKYGSLSQADALWRSQQ